MGNVNMQAKCSGDEQRRLTAGVCRHITISPRWLALACLAGSALLSAPAAHAQGILTVSPAGTTGITAGTGTLGFTNNASAQNGTLAAPSAVAFDTAGNIYVADTRNHAIRKIVAGGAISTVAGTGTAGYTGDGAAATSAQLDTPTGIAVDSSNNLYIADSNNNVIREVSASTGNIATIAGTGTRGFSGDSGAATSATLARPSGVAVDPSGNLYIADTNNQRIRKITGTTISTIAGTGVQGFSGDGAPATSAALDSPFGLATDSSGNVYFADRHNQRIREVNVSSGIISTIAGASSSFSGTFAGDGAAATAASLAHPSGIFLDAAGNLFIADTNNQRIRKITGTTIATVVGNGVQGFPTSGNAPYATALNSPTSAIGDALGNVFLADKLNNTITSSGSAYLSFAAQTVGSTSSGRTVILSNTGTASISVTAPTYTGPFVTVAGGTCTAFPMTITAGNNCTVLVGYMASAAGTQSGTATFSGSNVVSTTLQLAGTGTAVTPTKLVYTTSPATPITAGGNAGNFTVALEDASGNVATNVNSGSVLVTVTANGYLQSYSGPISNGVANFGLSSIALTSAQTYTYTATYSGLTNGVATEVVNPGPFSRLFVQAVSTYTAPQMSGGAAVAAEDTYGNLVMSFTGTVTLSSTDPTATYSPTTYTYTAGDAGAHAFTVIFNTAGTQTLTATSGSVTGSATGIVVEDAIWILNAADGAVRITDAGVQTTTAGSTSGSSQAAGIAFDNAGNVWTTQFDTSGFIKYSAAGAQLVSASSIGGLDNPASVFIDGSGQAWFANAGSGSVSLISNAGTAVSPAMGYQPNTTSEPVAIIVDSSGSVWVADFGGNKVVRMIGAAAPVATPLVTGTVNKTLGAKP